MKRISIIMMIIITLTGLGVFLSQNLGQTVNAQVIDQQAIVNSISADLKQQGMPITSIEILSDDRWNPPFVINCNLQSSDDDQGAFNNVTYFSSIRHNINLAQKNGLKAGATSITIVDINGKMLLNSTFANIKPTDLPSLFDLPSSLDNNAVSDLLDKNISLYGLSLSNLNIINDNYGLRKVVINLQASDIATADKAIPELVTNTDTKISQMNEDQKTRIAIYQINLNNLSGEPLFKYAKDLQTGYRCFFQIDALSKGWYSHP